MGLCVYCQQICVIYLGKFCLFCRVYPFPLIQQDNTIPRLCICISADFTRLPLSGQSKDKHPHPRPSLSLPFPQPPHHPCQRHPFLGRQVSHVNRRVMASSRVLVTAPQLFWVDPAISPLLFSTSLSVSQYSNHVFEVSVCVCVCVCVCVGVLASCHVVRQSLCSVKQWSNQQCVYVCVYVCVGGGGVINPQSPVTQTLAKEDYYDSTSWKCASRRSVCVLFCATTVCLGYVV